MTASRRPLQIHFFTSYVHPQGTYFRYHNLAVGLVRLGEQVTVFGCDLDDTTRPREEVREGVRYVIIPEAWKSSVFSQFNHPWTALRRYAKSYPPCDVSHLFQPFLGAAAGWGRCPAAVRFYDWDDRWTGGLNSGRPPTWRARWPWFIISVLEKRLPRRADHVTAPGDYLAAMARERGAPETTIIHNGYTPAPFDDKASARAKLKLDPAALYVGFMGRTTLELDWCFDAVRTFAPTFPNLRFALCGPPASVLEKLPAEVAARVDYLGQLSPAATRDFAAGIDLGLLPLADTPFNRSRYPIKFCEHLATGNPLLYSEVGEVARLAKEFTWALPAGKTREAWIPAFGNAIARLAAGDRPPAETDRLADLLSWDRLSSQLAETYRAALAKLG